MNIEKERKVLKNINYYARKIFTRENYVISNGNVHFHVLNLWYMLNSIKDSFLSSKVVINELCLFLSNFYFKDYLKLLFYF